MIRFAIRAVFPGGVLLFAAALWGRWAPIAQIESVARLAPWIVYPLGASIALGFHRSRLAFAILIVAATDAALLRAPEAIGAEATAVLAGALAVLVPLHFVAIALLPERGVASKDGAIVLGALAVEALLLRELALVRPSLLAPLLPGTTPVAIAGSSFALGRPALFAFGLALGVFAIRWLRGRGAVDRALVWASAASLAAFSGWAPAGAGAFGFTVAGVVLGLGALETSYELAYRDELTRLPTRRALEERLVRLGNRYTLAMVDVDRFKTFNDRHGHDAGDQVLRLVAARLDRVAGGGRSYRYGGEEFTVVFPGRGLDESLPHLEALREAIADHGFSLRGDDRPKKKPRGRRRSNGKNGQLSVTVSIGAAERNDALVRPSEVLEAADRALYRAKRGGRNRVETAKR